MACRRISFRPYRRVFRPALRTGRGEWHVRRGFVVRVEQAGRVGFGEVAPLPEFGGETPEAARRFLESLQADPSHPVPGELLCCTFALSAALTGTISEPSDYAVAGLLPSGEAAVGVAMEKAAGGYRTLKWKVGVRPIEREQDVFLRIIEILPAEILLRLDANGTWSEKTFECWLGFLQAFRGRIEFIEQPLAAGAESRMAAGAVESGIPIALDESLNGSDRLRLLNDWPGPLVIKPLLMGDCGSLLERLRPVADRVVFSSVFETGVGLLNVLRLADALPRMKYAVGFDTLCFSDRLACRRAAPFLRVEDRAAIDPVKLWNRLRSSV